MKRTYLPEYGHACCPHCKSEFGLAATIPTFLEEASRNDIIVYIMCPECHAAYKVAGDAARKSMSDTCFINFKIKGFDSDGAIYPWAITSMLTMELNNFDPVAAIENGHRLTRDQYFGICSGTHDFCVLPYGLTIVATKPTTSGAA
jgi:uncharacterized protein YbaR (Trm112 family)